MTFASTITVKGVMGNKKYRMGTWTCGSGDTGGDINTGLGICESIILQSTGSAVVASAPVVNETLPVAGSAVTIVTTDNEDGIWIAFGY